jgi:hypothetical protein
MKMQASTGVGKVLQENVNKYFRQREYRFL